MKIAFIIVIILDLVAVLIQTLALTLLISLKEGIVKRNQRLLLVTLCITEFIYAVADIAKACCILLDIQNVITLAIFLFHGTALTFFLIFIMIMITVDLFLEIYLNIKYSIYWSVRKTNVVLIVSLLMCCLLFIPLFIVHLRSATAFRKLVTYYIFPTLSLVFLIVFSFSYFYIIKQVLRHRKKTKQIQKQLRTNNTNLHCKQPNIRFKLFVPTLVIITFILFMICPNIIGIFIFIELLPIYVLYFTKLFVIVGFIADAVVFVFNLNGIRVTMRNLVWYRKTKYAK